MLQRACWQAALVLATLALPAGAQVKLEWKFKEGDKFYVENVSTLKQAVKTRDKMVKENVSTTIVSRMTVKKKTRSSVLLEQKVETVKARGKGDLGQAAELIGKMKGAVFTITLDRAGKITKFAGYKELVEKIRMIKRRRSNSASFFRKKA